MGMRNRERREAKARRKASRGTPRSRGERAVPTGPFGYPVFSEPTPPVEEVVQALWAEAFFGQEHRMPAALRRLESLPPSVVEKQGQLILLRILDDVWSRGWQPVELRRQVRLTGNAPVTRLAEILIHADHHARPGQRVDPRWADQIAALGGREVSTVGPWLAQWRESEGLSRAEAASSVAWLARACAQLGSLDLLLPPPGATKTTITFGAPARDPGRHPMLDRIRKLLAKAEATEFEEEAATFTAKAQELMTRHAIDAALLGAEEPGDVPRMIRVPIDAPYVDAKSMLLGVVARANRCQAVGLSGYQMSSVLGHAEDLMAVELLFTSLLIQAQKALAEAGRGGAGSRARSASFRSSFLIGYADRIHERLTVVNTAAMEESGTVNALPVLRAREEAVADFMTQRYGDSLVSGSIRGGYDPLGRDHGRRAADQARLDAGALSS